MSTRSGRRIHNSFHENTVKVEAEPERKTRGKRLKENLFNFEEAVLTANRRKNYVQYPSEDITEPAATVEVPTAKKKRGNTLKEHNEHAERNSAVEARKIPRLTRQTRKFAKHAMTEDSDSQAEGIAQAEVKENEDKSIKKKGKKSKREEDSLVKSESEEIKPEETSDLQEEPVTLKKSKKQKKEKEKRPKVANQNTDSQDSFHSAAGSPSNDVNKKTNTTDQETFFSLEDEFNPKTEEIPEPVDSKKSKMKKLKRQYAISLASEVLPSPKASLNSTFDKQAENEKLDTTFEKISEKRLSTIKTPLLKSPTNLSINFNSTLDKSPKISVTVLDSTFDKSETKMNTTFDKSESKINTTFHKNESKINTTFDKNDSKINTTFDKNESKINTTFDKNESKINTTFDKNESKINTTFDKIDLKKSSLHSSDYDSLNLTSDKSSSRVSITDDDEKTENIVNTTPVLIESSLDESQISVTAPRPSVIITKPTLDNKNSIFSERTPLKREGTFTKETVQIKSNENTSTLSVEKTPTKAPFNSTPGSTPFHRSRPQSSQRERTALLNVTRSLEKSHRSSEAPNPTRQTRVMFCSPENTPTVEMQLKRKVIKSSMKGSTKSFIVEEAAPRPVPASRKRSLTAPDVETSIKRARVEPPRSRTASAAAVPTPKPKTPSEPRSAQPSRTKLPNFAALHQRRFAKMESLDECQQRKARRAKQLLTPVAKTRDSKGSTTQKPGKPLTPTETPKVHTLESLRPGFTRFGFKLQSEINPFALPNKSETKSKEIRQGLTTKTATKSKEVRPKGLTTKTATKSKEVRPKGLALTNGSTGTKTKENKPNGHGLAFKPFIIGKDRKEMAKQVIMRERESKGDKLRADCREIIKGVRSNRRFELQMQMRNIE